MQLAVLIAALALAAAGCSASPSANRSSDVDTRIVGGQLALAGQFPYQVALLKNNRANCGGSLVSATYVLTAAHCVHENRGTGPRTPASAMSVRVGSLSLSSGGQVIRVAEIKPHPNYRFPLFDIALLHLSRAVTFSNMIRPIAFNATAIQPGGWVLVSGWGATQTGGFMTNELRYVYLTAMPDDDCYRFTARHASVFCLSHPRGRGICQGDSGGPAVQGGRLIGAMSFTLGGCGTDNPDGFARVPFLHNWIRENMG